MKYEVVYKLINICVENKLPHHLEKEGMEQVRNLEEFFHKKFQSND